MQDFEADCQPSTSWSAPGGRTSLEESWKALAAQVGPSRGASRPFRSKSAAPRRRARPTAALRRHTTAEVDELLEPEKTQELADAHLLDALLQVLEQGRARSSRPARHAFFDVAGSL